MDFAQKVKKIRKELGLSQEHLARELGVTFSTVNRWENGKSKPNNLAKKVFDQFYNNNMKIEHTMTKLRVATVFSGIGAAEHALERLGINHELVFASDNGDVNIFEKKIIPNYKSIEEEIIFLRNECNSDEIENSEALLYKLDKMDEKLARDRKLIDEYRYMLEIISNVDCAIDEYQVENYGKYVNWNEELDNSDYLILSNELKKIIKKKEPKSKRFLFFEKISKDKDYRRLTKELKGITKTLSQIHQSILEEKRLNELNEITDFRDKKKYVDGLYEKYNKSNNVKKMYLANYDISEDHFHWNVKFLDAKEYAGMVDLYVGGSPCQSFSIVGKRGGFEDTRGTLFYEYVKILRDLMPRFFIYENVKGVLNHDGGRTWETMKNTFRETGYYFKPYVLNAKNFGIPQNRERIFVVGFKNESDFNAYKDPKTTELEYLLYDFLQDTVNQKYYLQEKGVKFVTDNKNIEKQYTQINGKIALCQKANQQFNWHGDFIEHYSDEEVQRMSKIDDKYFLSDKVKKYVLDDMFYMNNKESEKLIDLEIARPLTATMHKMHRAGVDNYISYGKTLPAEDRRIRKLTPRECFRLMGFCDSFQLVVSDTQLYKQAGNSIVVDVLMSILKNLTSISDL